MQNLKLRKVMMSMAAVVMSIVCGVSTFAQGGDITVKGTVIDESGLPIVGAAVVVVGSTTGTVTDIDGNFQMSVPSNASLQVAFIGYTTVQEAVNGRSVINFTLHDEFAELSEVQVVAYGAQKKVTVTGAISSVKAEDLVRTPVSSVNNVLAGQLSGVTTVQYSGEPGSDAADIFVRGKATWVDASPLIQVDGVERSMSDIDPNEIESITVLKDASATAVFGVRGANGVILITTKRGKEGKANIDVSTSFSALSPTKMVEMASSLEYAEFYNAQRANDGQTPLFSEDVIQKFRTGEDPIRFPSVDWADYIMKDVTLQTQSNLSINGGNDKVKYFVSVGMFTQGGLFKEFDLNYHLDYRYQRFNYRSNIDLDVTKSTTISIGVSGKLDRTQKPKTGQGASGMIKNIYYSTPFSSPGVIDGRFITNNVNASDNTLYDENGNAYQEMLPFLGGNGMAYYLTGGRYRQDNTKIQIDLSITQKLDMLLEGLSLKVKGAYNSSYYVQNTADGGSVATYTPVMQPDGSMIYRKTGEDKDPSSFKNDLGKGRDWYIEAQLNYTKKFDLHTLNVLALYNQSNQYYQKEYKDIPRSYIGLVGRISYDWNNRYMAEINFGYNGSENFAPEKRYGTFPAGSVGWALSEESFFDVVKPWISFAKLRASWGLVGNDKVPENKRFLYLPDPYIANQNGVPDHDIPGYNFGVEEAYGGNVTSLGSRENGKNNPDITWETAFKQDYGIDINFFDNKLTTTFDYFTEKRKDIILQDKTAPSILGYRSEPYSNLGEVKSWGWEVSLGWNQTVGDNWRFWSKFNLSYNQNEILVDKQAPQNNEYMYTKGRRIGARSQHKFVKFAEQSDIDAINKGEAPVQSYVGANLKVGDAIFADLDNNGVVDANDNSRDFGYTDDPQYIAGLTIGFQYKGLSFNAQMTGAWHVSRMVSDVFRRPFTSAAGTTEGGLLKYHVENTWTAENPSQDSEYPRATFTNGSQNYATSTLYEKDSKYLRLKTAEISYNFDFPFMKTIGLSRLQLAVNGYNLLTFTPYLWGDPETRASNAPSYPLQRTYTASLRLGF